MKTLTYGAATTAAAVTMCLVISCAGMGAARMNANETAAIASLKVYLTAQSIFHRNDHDQDNVLEYAADLDELCYGKAGGAPLQLIDAQLANADDDGAQGAAPVAKYGYLFHDLKGYVKDGENVDFGINETGSPGYVGDCGLLAYPAVYGKTGRKAFVIGADGTVYEKDAAGMKPFDYLPDCQDPASGWVIAGY
ncbi:MAG: DUF2950 family protein [Planctomycetes bacterium]|nr:DUF2950 family protein [Planctomycetota bacterium]